jgi:hypothetical protein
MDNTTWTYEDARDTGRFDQCEAGTFQFRFHCQNLPTLPVFEISYGFEPGSGCEAVMLRWRLVDADCDDNPANVARLFAELVQVADWFRASVVRECYEDAGRQARDYF